ncbi:MAG: tyrosine-type recombinase/integrase [Vulcanimicrobiota bacterium]
MALLLYKTRYSNIKRNTKRASPSSTYYVVFDVTVEPALETSDGKRKKPKKKKFRIPIGQADPEDKNALERIRKRGLQLMQATKAPAPPKPLERTLAEAIELDRTNRRARLEDSTMKRYDLSYRNLAAAFGAETPLSEITEVSINLWMLTRQHDLSNSTINRDLTRLKAVFKMARRAKWIRGNPLDDVDPLPEPDGRTRYLSPAEFDRLWAVSCPWLWRIVMFAVLTGLRQGEHFGLKWSQIRNGQIHLKGRSSDRKEGTKGKRPRVIPIIPDVQEILDQVRGDHEELVFVTLRKKRLNVSNFKRDFWTPALEAARIEDLTWHDLRHTFCSLIVQRGGDLEKVQLLAGHSDFRTTKGYTHMAPEHLVETIGLLKGLWREPQAVPIGWAKGRRKRKSS